MKETSSTCLIELSGSNIARFLNSCQTTPQKQSKRKQNNCCVLIGADTVLKDLSKKGFLF